MLFVQTSPAAHKLLCIKFSSLHLISISIVPDSIRNAVGHVVLCTSPSVHLTVHLTVRGPAAQAWHHRTDGKLYRLHMPQTPIARTATYGAYAQDEFPSGTNAVVAVVAYTGAPPLPTAAAAVR